MSARSEPSAPEPVTPTLLRGWPLPGTGAGKDDRGTVLIIGGARRTPGAALLAGTAALRAGAGRLTLAVAGSTAVQLAVALPEAGVVGLAETADGSVRAAGAAVLAEDLKTADAVLIGPGLDNVEEAGSLLLDMLQGGLAGQLGAATSIILDAYALGCLPDVGRAVEAWAGRLILTPNPTEAAILLGRGIDPAKDIAEIADRYQAVVSCQGMIAEPAGTGSGSEPSAAKLWEITTGNGGLGTSGSGDVLAGAIAGLRARGTTDAQAACWGTHLHAAAGDRLSSRLGNLGYLARELADALPPLMMELGT